MIIQNYLIIVNNVVTNVVVWDGDTQTWTPPIDSIQLIQATTPAMIWVGIETEIMPPTVPPTYTVVYELKEEIGKGDIEFTWNGSVLTTNQPMPIETFIISNNPTTGLQTA